MSAKITVYRGTSYPVTYNHVDGSGAPVSLVGKTLYFTVKANVYDEVQDDSSALIKKTITSHTNPSGGISGFTLTDVDTYIDPGKYFFSFLVEDSTNQTNPPSVFGDFVVKGQPGNRQTVNG